MKLFTNGCSFTAGGGILEEERGLSSTLEKELKNKLPMEDRKFREESVWPYHLHKLLNTTELVNKAIGCGSNARIVRTTLDFFTDKINKGEDVSEWIAIIQWTEPSRYETYDEFSKDYNLIKVDVVIPKVDTNTFNRLQMRFGEHENTFIDEWNNHICLLSAFFDKWNIKYLFATLQPMITRDDYGMNYINWLGDTPITSSLIDIEEHRYESFHPNLQGHKYIAQRVYSKLLYQSSC